MTQPHDSHPQSLEQAVIAWADASAGLARALRQLDYDSARPGLSLVPRRPLTITAAVLVVAFAVWLRTYHCACQWGLAIELHPGYDHATGWCCAIGSGILLRAGSAVRARLAA